MGLSRRHFLKQTSVGAVSLAAGTTAPLLGFEGGSNVQGRIPPAYKQRIAFGAWINDMRNTPLPLQNWPAPQLDRQTIDSAIRAMDVQSEAGLNFIDAWGLFATYGYPPDIKSAFADKGRVRAVRELLEAAAKRKMRFMFGLGLFSWGYDQIIKQDPVVRGLDDKGSPHPHAMCGAKEEAWAYVEKILDCALNGFDFHGVHLESCDLGCCMCPKCAGKDGLVGYNVRLNIRAADYIKKKWPHQFVNSIPINWVSRSAGPNTGPFTREEKRHVVELSKHIDCLMDQGWRGTFVAPDERKAFVGSLHCDYGTSGGIWLYHCVRRNRLSYFMPYPKGTASAIKEHYADGARGCMLYQGPMINPAVEVNTAVAGRLLCDTTRSAEDALAEVIELYYRPKTASAHKKLVDVYNRAEDAFFGSWPEAAKKNPHRPGEFHLEPLFGTAPQKSIYLEQCLTAKGRAQYRKGLISVLEALAKLEDQCDDDGRIQRIRTCVISVLIDIENIGYERV